MLIASSDTIQGTKLTVRVVAAGQVVTAESPGVDASGNATATLSVPAGVGTVQAFAEYIPPPPTP